MHRSWTPSRKFRMVTAVLTCGMACLAQNKPSTDVPGHHQALAEYLAAQANLPVIERSDWVNVKTDVKPGAVGDGVADDSAAIQAALAKMEGSRPTARPVYFPPGTYRITQTLSVTQVQGGAIYGHGRATVIVWDGKDGERMFHSNGFGRNLFFGLTWDGRGKAAVGVDHDSKGYYETRVRHQYCEFRNFTDSGIRVGHDQTTASAEMMFYDCEFEKCGRGIAFLAFNDYDNSIARCIFRDCGSAIHCYRGNVYVRDCHFENSRKEDLLLSVHSHSIRRCTSLGANAFVRGSQAGNFAQLVAVQDCLVSDWRDPVGAVQLANCGPVLVFDSVFSAPTVEKSPAIALVNDAAWQQTLLTANVRYDGVAQPLANPQAGNRVVEIPRTQPDFLIKTSAANRWSHRPLLPGKIFDAKVDFGAVGDGQADDSAAIQKAIDAAAAFGNHAQAYLPAGTYQIKKTLKLGPGKYSLAGPVARRTELVWAGPADGTLIHAHNTDGAVLNQLFTAAPKGIKATAIRVTADRPGAMVLDGIFSGGNRQPEFRGTLLERLPAGFTVTAPHLDGELTIDGCGDATVLLDYWFTGYDAAMTVRGPNGKGFLGIHSAAGSHNDPDLTVEDNASIVIGDFYTEQTLRSLIAKGQPGQTPGRVTVSYAKQAFREADGVRIDGYSGQVTVSRANMMYRPGLNAAGKPVGVGEKAVTIGDAQAVLPIAGGKDCVFLLLGNTSKTAAPKIELKDATLVQVGGNVWRSDGERSALSFVPDTPDREAMIKAVNVALNHFRELSQISLRLFPQPAPEKP